jgi:hypothetical protein
MGLAWKGLLSRDDAKADLDVMSRSARALSDLCRPLVEQPVVGLEPDRSDPRMRLKQNWSFQCRRAFGFRLPIEGLRTTTRFGDESNQVS